MLSDKGDVVHMKEPVVEATGWLSKRGSHFKVLSFCLICTIVYIYLYSNLTIRTMVVNDMMQNTINDLQRWKNKVEGWVRGFSELSQNQSIVSTVGQVQTEYRIEKNNESIHLFDPVQTTTQSQLLTQHWTKYKTLKERIAALKDAIIRNEVDPLLTLFTTWPTKAEKFLVHNSTIKNWNSLYPFVRSVFFTNEEDLASRVKSMGWSVLPIVQSAVGIPILKYMYTDTMLKFKSTFYAYSNGDILFTEGLVETLISLLTSDLDFNKPLMIVGQRTNVQDMTQDETSSFDKIIQASNRGKRFTPYAEDYFITNAIYPWKECAEVVIGRRAYDNWLVLNARKRDHITIDGTKTILAVHQTTKAGNFEGHGRPNSNYNDRLLVKLYRRVYYGSGLTSCTSYYTLPSASGGSKLEKRKVHKSCFPL
ncbi:uncharacterized protein [Mytilus edulis]|uniref:uncharacterized protein isoform X2 n=1 Tax=Mytilus edulis TaxID=6550 RepID=UPI0039EE4C88